MGKIASAWIVVYQSDGKFAGAWIVVYQSDGKFAGAWIVVYQSDGKLVRMSNLSCILKIDNSI